MSTSALGSPVFRVALVQDHPGETQVVNPMDAALLFKKHIGDYDREALAVIMLDPGKRLIGFNLVSIGTLTQTAGHPRLCFRTHNRGYVLSRLMLRQPRVSSETG